MIDAKKLIGINRDADPPCYVDDIVLTAEEQIDFVDWIASVFKPCEGVSLDDLLRWRNALSIHGLKRGREGDRERIQKAMSDGWLFMGSVFGRYWFAVMS